MSTEGLLISLTLLVLGIVWVVFPLTLGARTRRAASDAARQREDLLLAYEQIVAGIRDLDDDFNAGKLVEADYQRQRAGLAERGVALLSQLDAAQVAPAVARVGADSREIDRAIEAAVAARKKTGRASA